MSNVIVGIGTYLPERIVTNDELEAMDVDYDRARAGGVSLDEWARSRHGAVSRHWARPDECTSDMATAPAPWCFTVSRRTRVTVFVPASPDRTGTWATISVSRAAAARDRSIRRCSINVFTTCTSCSPRSTPGRLSAARFVRRRR